MAAGCILTYGLTFRLHTLPWQCTVYVGRERERERESMIIINTFSKNTVQCLGKKKKVTRRLKTSPSFDSWLSHTCTHRLLEDDKDLFGRRCPLCCGLINALSVSLRLRTKPSALINNTRPGPPRAYTHQQAQKYTQNGLWRVWISRQHHLRYPLTGQWQTPSLLSQCHSHG